MDDVGRCLWGTVCSVLFAGLGMYFSANGTAIAGVSASKLQKLAEEGNAKAALLLERKKKQFEHTVRAGLNGLVCLLLSFFLAMTTWFLPLETLLLPRLSGDAALAADLSLVIVAIVSLFLLLLFGYALPKKLVSHNPEPFAFATVGPARALDAVFGALTWLPLGAARLLERMFGLDPNEENAGVTEEEIRMLVDAGNEKGTIEYSERKMINNVFEFDDRTAGEVMTHRTDIEAVQRDAPLAEVLELSMDKGYSRIPVYEDDIDDIVGIVYAKDLLALVGRDDWADKTVADTMRPVIYVPESTRCRMLFRKFKESKVHMAVIVDEYGGTAGIATMEDLLESIVGNIQDEYDQETDEIEKLDEGRYSLDGGVTVEEAEELFGADLGADEDTETLGGLIANTLGRIPNDGEVVSVTIGEVEFTVVVVEDRRIVRIHARKLPEAGQAQA